MTVDWTTTLALVTAVCLAVYLTAALLKPEKFS
jgi:K+-transporting ATPase KdpF subunit